MNSLFKRLPVALMMLVSIAASAADINVKGRVVDASGEPVIGAGVIVVGAAVSTGVITDVDGNFTLQADSRATLRISSIGYQSRDILASQVKGNIILQEEHTALDEVVVIGYGALKSKELTSAISHIGQTDFNHISSLDAAMLLQGKVSSVSISNTSVADPNSYGSIQIRGISSRNAGLDPLVVIDGIPGGDLTNVNPADIESFDVLKDGAASAIYGTRASNGVILVNLKKSSKDGNVHTTYGATLTLNSAKRELDIMDAAQYRAYRCVTNPLADLGGTTDWFDATTKLGFSHQHTISVSGGSARNNYRVTADYRYATGIDLRSDRREYGARANFNHMTKSGLFTFTGNIVPRIIRRNKSASVFGATITNNHTMPVYDENSANGYYRVPSGSENTNIVETQKETISDSKIMLFEWNASAKINLLPLLAPAHENISLTSQLTFSEHITNKFNGSFSPSTYGPNVNTGTKGHASRDYSTSRSDNLEWVTNFTGQFGGHKLRAMLGYSYLYGVGESMSAENYDFDSDAVGYNNLGSGMRASEDGKVYLGSSKSDHKLIGFFARVNYDYKEKYLISASIRREGSSRFGANHKWGNFPAVSIGWRMSDEPWMAKAEWINDLKLRYDFGVTGNEDIGNYKSLSTYRSFGYYQYEDERFVVWGPSANTNTDLRWEKGYNQNFGIDFSILKNRVSGSLNYFLRYQVDLLGEYSVPIPPNLFSSIYANVGTLRNNGFEFDLNFDIVRRNDWNYRVTLVGSTNDNRFMSFSNDIYTGESYYLTCQMSNPNNPGCLQIIQEGERIGNYFTYRYAGVDNSGDWLIYDRHGNVIPISKGTTDDKSVTGNGLPKFTGSLTQSLSYKNWDFNVALRGAAGFQIFNVHDFYFGLRSTTTNQLTTAWSKNAHVTTGKNVITDYFLENGSYLKIDNMTLGYTLPVNKRFLQKVRFYFTASNLHTFTRFSGVDPSTYEYNGLTPGTFGGAYTYYPSAFQFIFGVQVNF